MTGATGETILDLAAAVELMQRRDIPAASAPSGMLELIQRNQVESLNKLAVMIEQDQSLSAVRLPRSEVRFRAPVERPGKIICLAGIGVLRNRVREAV